MACPLALRRSHLQSKSFRHHGTSRLDRPQVNQQLKLVPPTINPSLKILLRKFIKFEELRSIVCENKASNTTNIAVATFKKADWDTMSIWDKNGLISLISSNQQIKFKNLLITTTELEKMDKTHSLKLLITIKDHFFLLWPSHCLYYY